MTVYFQVLLPLKTPWLPWYKTEGQVHRGQRVRVKFRGKVGIALVWSEPQSNSPQGISRILSIESEEPALADISREEMRLWEFVSSYYLCTLGEVYKAAYPQTKRQGERISESSRARAENTREKMKESIARRISKLEARLEAKKATLERPHRSEELVLKLQGEVKALEKELSAARESLENLSRKPEPKAVQGVLEAYPKPVLLCSEDRVKKYLGEIRNCLSEGRSALVLECENGFSPALEKALSKEFPLYRYSSSAGSGASRKATDAARGGEAAVFLGTRSAVFLPFSALGLVIVDEEEDPGYKQQENGPRYNGRDTATVLAKIHGANLILGATLPSLESLCNALGGKYQLLASTPQTAKLTLIGVNDERHKKGMDGNYSFKALKLLHSFPRDASVRIIRCFQSEEDAQSEAKSVLPDRETEILTPHQGIKAQSRSDVTLVLQADALFDRKDFRADEKAVRILYTLALKTGCLIVQASDADLPAFGILSQLCCGVPLAAALSPLLEERKKFSLPPYTRLVDVYGAKGELKERVRLAKGKSADRGNLLKSHPDCTFDADPL